MKKGSEQLDPDPSSWPARVSQRYYFHYYYFGPGHFGWLFWLSQGFALPLKCPELPACGLSAKAAAAPPKDIVSASISAVINNVIRRFIFSPPLTARPKTVTKNSDRPPPSLGGVAGCATGSTRPPCRRPSLTGTGFSASTRMYK